MNAAGPEAVVEIDDVAGTVLLDGDPVEVPDGADPRAVGLHAAAWRIAHVLGRPVPVLVRHGADETRWVVRPDGSADAVRDSRRAIAPPPPPVAAPPVDAAPVTPARRPVSPWLGWGLGTVAGSAAIGAVVAVLALTGGEPGAGSPDAAPTTDVRTVADDETPSPTPAPLPTPTATTPTPAPVVRTLAARALGGTARLRLVVTASRRPVRATVVVVRAGGRPVERRVRLTRRSQDVVVTDLRPGRYRWRVTVRDATPVTGRVRVAAPAPPPSTGSGSGSGSGSGAGSGGSVSGGSGAPSTGGGGGGGGAGGDNGPDAPVAPDRPKKPKPKPTAPVPQ